MDGILDFLDRSNFKYRRIIYVLFTSLRITYRGHFPKRKKHSRYCYNFFPRRRKTHDEATATIYLFIYFLRWTQIQENCWARNSMAWDRLAADSSSMHCSFCILQGRHAACTVLHCTALHHSHSTRIPCLDLCLTVCR